ncbi:MAG: ABC transporter substrate-binding protein, partial [Acidimicrobiia bacterium]
MKRESRRFVTPLAILAALASACGGAGDQARKGAGAEDKKAPEATAVEINQLAREELQDGGTLRWPLTQMPSNFNTSHLDGTLADGSAVMDAMLPRLFNFDSSAQPSPNRDYVLSAELTSKVPKQVVTYKINPKASWHDGAPITIADFEAHWKARNGTNEDFKVASTQGYDKIESVVAGSDEREVVVTYATPYADWQGLFSNLYPLSTNRDPAVFNDGWKERPLNTAGPFKLDNVDPTAKTITLVRNEKWWG